MKQIPLVLIVVVMASAVITACVNHSVSDTVLIREVNTKHWPGLQVISSTQLERINPVIRTTYRNLGPVLPGSVLAYMLGLGDRIIPGEVQFGTDGLKYRTVNRMYVRE